MSKRLNRFIVVILTLALALPVQFVMADDISDTQSFRKQVTLAGIREHQTALQAISNANGGNRVSGSPGFDASAQYVYDRAVAAGYNVRVQEFTFQFDGDNSLPVLQKKSPGSAKYVDGVDYDTMQFSGSGDFTAPLTAVDLLVPSPAANASTSGCEAADFAGFTPGHIALMQRGTCGFVDKALNAQAAGAVGVIVFNEGNPGRTALNLGTLGTQQTIPSITTSFAIGDSLRNGVLNGPTGVTIRLRVDYFFGTRTTKNVIAETPSGDPNRVVVIGAHLDSVTRGAGINDNGSGTATILEIAETFAAQGLVPHNKLRFMWYGAEELTPGLIGSTFYVNSLSQAERDKIELMLNFDMVGSPNFVRFVYDGNNSGGGGTVGPAGSGAIEQLFLDYFNSQNLPTEPTPFNGRSDYGPFIAVGIPAGGLFTGAEGIKTEAQATVYGGTAGQQYDPCYHLACDTFTNNSNRALDQMSDAAAHAVLLYSKRDFATNPLVDPVAITSAATSVNSDLHDHHEEAEPK